MKSSSDETSSSDKTGGCCGALQRHAHHASFCRTACASQPAAFHCKEARPGKTRAWGCFQAPLRGLTVVGVMCCAAGVPGRAAAGGRLRGGRTAVLEPDEGQQELQRLPRHLPRLRLRVPRGCVWHPTPPLQTSCLCVQSTRCCLCVGVPRRCAAPSTLPAHPSPCTARMMRCGLGMRMLLMCAWCA